MAEVELNREWIRDTFLNQYSGLVSCLERVIDGITKRVLQLKQIAFTMAVVTCFCQSQGARPSPSVHIEELKMHHGFRAGRVTATGWLPP